MGFDLLIFFIIAIISCGIVCWVADRELKRVKRDAESGKILNDMLDKMKKAKLKNE